MKNRENEPQGQAGEKRLRGLFGKFFEKFDVLEEQKLARVLRGCIFTAFFLLEALVFVQTFSAHSGEGFWTKFLLFTIAAGVFDVVEAVNMFLVKNGRAKAACYVVDILALATMIAASGNSYLCVLYMLVLTECYLWAKRTRTAVLIFALSLPLYVVVNWFALTIFFGRTVSYTYAITNSLGAIVLLVAHFLIFNFAVSFYRQYVRLSRALKELDESQSELKKANADLATAAATMERQRIAKEIHDTAGHSITTVIMQTEAAKLVIDEDPSEAKKRLIAANLQAKHALEELRESVHLLSGREEGVPLKAALERIVQDSTDGTFVTIRSEIEDFEVDAERYRFLCNTLKEGISNGLRHGKATAFWLEVKRTDGGIEFLLSDNGIGGKTEELKKGFGLSSMAQHAERLGGKAEFSAETDEGFEIHITLPFGGKENG